jgi:predicted nuclease of restriction endonuclease-like RecB superfamily
MTYLYSLDNFICSGECLHTYLKTYEKKDIPANGVRFFSKMEIENQRTERNVWSRDLNEFFRSEWELIVAGFLNYIDTPYLYESVIIKINKRHYIPDFFLPDLNLLVEVKGLWLSGSKAKLRKMAKVRPDLKVLVIPWILRRSLLEYMKNAKKDS